MKSSRSNCLHSKSVFPSCPNSATKLPEYPNVGLGQNVQPLQVCQMKSIVLVIHVLHAAVLLDLSRVGQVNRLALAAQTIDQQIPVEVQFDRHRLKLRLVDGLRGQGY